MATDRGAAAREHEETPPEEVASGLWAIPVRIPNGIAYSYAFDVGDGLVMVDLGFSNQRSLESLEAGLAAVGATVEEIRGVLFTHGHSEHYGLAGPVKERSGAWLAMHEGDNEFLEQARAGEHDGGRAWKILEWAGVPAPEEPPAEPRGGPRWQFPPPAADRYLVDGERIQVGARHLTVHCTPGHAEGHVCFVVEGEGLVFVGDHVLSRTTPNVSAWPETTGDPLGDYIGSLAATERFGAGLLGLPGHQERLMPLELRARQIREYHEEQLREVLEIVGSGGVTIADVAQRMEWSRPWSELGISGHVMAVGEAHAHLRLLETRGKLERLGETPERWRPRERADEATSR